MHGSLLPQCVKPLKETWSEDKHQARMAAANVAAAFAEIESKAGFPFMHEFALVGLWGAIEATVEDLIVALLLNEPSLLQREQFAKIKISLAEYELLDKEERMRFLVIELQRTLRTGQRQGVAVLNHCSNAWVFRSSERRGSEKFLGNESSAQRHCSSAVASRSYLCECLSLVKCKDRRACTCECLYDEGTCDDVVWVCPRYGLPFDNTLWGCHAFERGTAAAHIVLILPRSDLQHTSNPSPTSQSF